MARRLIQPQLPPQLDPQGLVPVARPVAMAPRVAAALPPAQLPTTGIVPVGRDLTAPPPLPPSPGALGAVQDALGQVDPRQAALQRAGRAIAVATPEQRAQMAAVGGAALGRVAAARNNQLQRAGVKAAAREEMLKRVVSEKALPQLASRLPGLLGR